MIPIVRPVSALFRFATSITSWKVSFKLPVEGVIAKRQPFLGSQCFDLGEREILGKPAGLGHPVDRLGRLAVGEFGMSGDVGCVGNVRLVPGNQYAVFGRDEIRLDVIGAELYR